MIKKLLLLFLIPFISLAQYNPRVKEYIHKSIVKKKDTIRYHIYTKGNIEDKKNILIYFHGSGPFPLFSQTTKIDTLINSENQDFETQKTLQFKSSISFNLNKIPSDYIFVLISKKGVPFLEIDNQFIPSKLFYKNEGLDYRVWQGNEVIKDITKKIIKKPQKIVILGHSEGSDVVAKLGHVNKKVTHIGYWAGGGSTQYYDLALSMQKEIKERNKKQVDASISFDSLFNDIKNIEKDPNNTEKQWLGNSYRRWSQFSEPPIDNLLKLDKPLFVAVGGKDESVPIESSLLIPIEFIRHHKENLTFKIYPELNHSFAIPPKTEKGRWERKFMEVFEDFLKWIDN